MQICAHLLLFWCFFGALPWCSPYAFDLILVFLGKNGAPGWCKICAHLVLFFQHGAPGWCKMCPHLAFFPSRWCSWLVHNLCSSGVFSSKLCSWLLHSSGVFSSKWFSWLVRNLCPSDLFFFKMVLLARLLAGATCVLIWCFPSKWCSWLVQNLLMLPQQRSRQGNMIYGWLKIRCFSGAFLGRLWSSWCKWMCAHLVFFLEVVLAAGAKRGRLEVNARAEDVRWFASECGVDGWCGTGWIGGEVGTRLAKKKNWLQQPFMQTILGLHLFWCFFA